MGDITRYFEILGAGDSESLLQMFSGEPKLDDPRSGSIRGAAALAGFCREYPGWLGDGHADLISSVAGIARSVAEFVLHVRVKGAVYGLPVAVAADRAIEGRFSSIRVYHSMWPLLGRHVFRPAILPEDKSIVIPDMVGEYHAALTAGDLDGIMDSFEDDGYAREPAGGEWVYQGKDRLREFYGMLFADEGGILLEHCSLTDDGTAAVLEYNAMSWGKTPLKGQAGIAVYERGKSGRLHAARIYDDVNPPV